MTDSQRIGQSTASAVILLGIHFHLRAELLSQYISKCFTLFLPLLICLTKSIA